VAHTVENAPSESESEILLVLGLSTMDSSGIGRLVYSLESAFLRCLGTGAEILFDFNFSVT
jgi:hypothetical protein